MLAIAAALIVAAAILGSALLLARAVQRAVQEMPTPEVTVELVAVRTEHDVNDSRISSTVTVGEIHGADRVEAVAVSVRGSGHAVTGCHITGADVGVVMGNGGRLG